MLLCRVDISQIPSGGLIAIDGDPGAGKTSLSKQIVSHHPRSIVSLDDYIQGDGKPYMDQLQLAAVERAIDACNGNAIVEGVHLLEALNALGLKPNHLIFCKAIVNGEWQFSPLQSITPKARLASTVIAYYRAYQPWLQADLVLEHIVH